jgi:glycosyltransferase involved in cell wall biosynthesis
MPNVVMEAQLMGTPVVATRVGGTPDTVIDGKTAILCPARDADALAQACLELLTDPARARRMGQAGHSFVTDNFPREKLARRYLDLVIGEERVVPRMAASAG